MNTYIIGSADNLSSVLTHLDMPYVHCVYIGAILYPAGKCTGTICIQATEQDLTALTLTANIAVCMVKSRIFEMLIEGMPTY